MNRLNAKFVATLRDGKEYDGAILYLYKHKDVGAQWLYRYIVYGNRHKMELGGIKKYLF
ncbi:DUF4102 domain-containing protein [Bartonella machadoae]|uniref:DUF4102 domain-containing protein n=1 Tax=Bartonella machadoae TaxID=2893471 RepID=UPI001F4C968B|nr:DUF4102 domain-containing protein [Bartonella machadoae]UNE54726.1 DUF4102 domain-containing protein [Bartonella machadoae]